MLTIRTTVRRLFFLGLFLAIPGFGGPRQSQGETAHATSLSQGNDAMRHWRGRPHLDPREEQAMDAATKEAKQAEWDRDRDQHWKVVADEQQGQVVFVSDGEGVFLTTQKDYADFDLELDYKLVQPRTDSGIYLRGSPQVQIWDPNDPGAIKNGADKGSGALWNNTEGNAGKWPLVLADSPIGEWNHLRIRMIGARVWVWLNDKMTVDGAILENYFDRNIPMFRTGPIQLQTHGGEIQFRRIKVTELGSEAANEILRADAATGFEPLFDGKSLTGWDGPKDSARVEDGTLIAQSGTLFTSQEYSDFQLYLEFLLPPAGNNGLAIRYPGNGDGAYDGMCELQVLDTEDPKYAEIDPRQAHGSAYGMVAAHRGYLRPVGEWNSQMVTVQGSKIRVELNGTPILDCDLDQVTEFMSDSPHQGLKRQSGHIGLCGHGDPVRFRQLRVKPIRTP
jgi:Domain of Unknown Function (DUF1080)